MGAVLVSGTISMTVPSLFAEPYYPEYEDPYVKDYKKDPKSINVQKIKCVNSNANVNGIDINEFPPHEMLATEEAQATEDGAAEGNGNGLVSDNGLNIDRNLLNICADLNFNNQERIPIIGDFTTTDQ
ncbi:MAG: hypothetical protein ACE5SW_08215 [Nitrososphaeraceae archaeon]